MALGRLRYRTSHATFCVAFPFGLFAVSNAINIDKLARWFTLNEGVDLVGLAAYLFAALCLFIAFFALIAHRRTVKPFAALIVVLSAAATYFIAKYDVAVDSSMIMNVINTDPTEVRGLMSLQMLPYVLLLVVVPVAVILAGDITFEPSARYLLASGKLFAGAFVLAIAVLYLNHNAVIRAGNVSKKYIVYSLVPLNLLSGGLNAAFKSMKPWFASDDPVEIRGNVTSRDSIVVVLAIGESSRRGNFSLYGYARKDTNPVLGRMAGLHLLDGTAKKGSTLYALPEILEKSGLKLTEVASRLGVPTACYVNFTLYDNCEAVGEVKASNCGHGGTCYDEDVIPLLRENLRSHMSGPRLVVLHLGGGSHGPIYRDRYPPEFRKFQPMCNDADVANRCTLEELYNSYDNTILYVDYVLGGILRTLDASGTPYVFIYLSDHGESLLDEGRMFHGMPPGMGLPPEQADVPLIVKASVPIAIAPRAQYTQPDVYDTVLDLLSIETPLFDRRGSFIRKGEAGQHRVGRRDDPEF
jgi:lipid A ethanolaminephosphotransferase